MNLIDLQEYYSKQASVHVNFKLSKEAILFLKELKKEYGFSPKKLFDSLSEFSTVNNFDYPVIRKTLVISHVSLNQLNNLSKEYSIKKDTIVNDTLLSFKEAVDSNRLERAEREQRIQNCIKNLQIVINQGGFLNDIVITRL